MRFSNCFSMIVAASHVGAAVAGPLPQYRYGQSSSTVSESTVLSSTVLSPASTKISSMVFSVTGNTWNYTIPFTLRPPSAASTVSEASFTDTVQVTTELSPISSLSSLIAFPSSSLVTPRLGTGSWPPFLHPSHTVPTGMTGPVSQLPVPTTGSNLTISYSLAPSLSFTVIVTTAFLSSQVIPSLVLSPTSLLPIKTTTTPSPRIGTGTSFFPTGSGFPHLPSGKLPGSNLTISYNLPAHSTAKFSLISSAIDVANSTSLTTKTLSVSSAIGVVNSSSITPPPAVASSSVTQSLGTTIWTTSVVYTTTLITVTSCAAAVTNCPAHSTATITSVIPIYTTVCPVVSHTIDTKLSPTAVGTLSGSLTVPTVTAPVGTASSGSPPAPSFPSSSVRLSISYSLAPTISSSTPNAVFTAVNPGGPISNISSTVGFPNHGKTGVPTATAILPSFGGSNKTVLFPTGTGVSSAILPSLSFGSGAVASSTIITHAIPNFTLASSLVPHSTLVTSSRTTSKHGGNGGKSTPTAAPSSLPPAAPTNTYSPHWWKEFEKWLQELAAWFQKEKAARTPKI